MPKWLEWLIANQRELAEFEASRFLIASSRLLSFDYSVPRHSLPNDLWTKNINETLDFDLRSFSTSSKLLRECLLLRCGEKRRKNSWNLRFPADFNQLRSSSIGGKLSVTQRKKKKRKMEKRNSCEEFSRAYLILSPARETSFSPVCEKLRSKKLHQSWDIQSRWHGRTLWKKSSRVLFSHSWRKRKKRSKFLNLKTAFHWTLPTRRAYIFKRVEKRNILFEKEIYYWALLGFKCSFLVREEQNLIII